MSIKSIKIPGAIGIIFGGGLVISTTCFNSILYNPWLADWYPYKYNHIVNTLSVNKIKNNIHFNWFEIRMYWIINSWLLFILLKLLEWCSILLLVIWLIPLRTLNLYFQKYKYILNILRITNFMNYVTFNKLMIIFWASTQILL